MPDPDLAALTALRRLRRVQTDSARRDLGDAVLRETALAERSDASTREVEAARGISGDFDREVLAAWFVRMQAERARLADAMLDAERRTGDARTALAQRRVAETAAEAALTDALAAKAAEVARREQVMLEDIARALRRAAG